MVKIAPRRDWLFLHCQDSHDWVFAGGRACNCEPACCSVPVYQCAKCGDYDYGYNDETREVEERCKLWSLDEIEKGVAA